MILEVRLGSVPNIGFLHTRLRRCPLFVRSAALRTVDAKICTKMKSFPEGALEPLAAIMRFVDLTHSDFDPWRKFIDTHPRLVACVALKSHPDAPDELAIWIEREQFPLLHNNCPMWTMGGVVIPRLDDGFGRFVCRHFLAKLSGRCDGSLVALVEKALNVVEPVSEDHWPGSLYETQHLDDIWWSKSWMKDGTGWNPVRIVERSVWESVIVVSASAQRDLTSRQIAESSKCEIGSKGSNKHSADLERRRRDAIEWVLSYPSEKWSDKPEVLKLVMDQFKLTENAAKVVWDRASQDPRWDPTRSDPGRKPNRKKGCWSL